MAIGRVAGEDFLVGDLDAGDVETTSCPKSTVWAAQYVALGYADNGIYLYGARRECKSCRCDT